MGLMVMVALLSACGGDEGCPPALDDVTRLIVVTTATMEGPAATLETFERTAPTAPWERRTGPEPVVVGAAGLGWGFTFRALARPGEPLKQEGDRRTPAGVFAIGPAFGFEPSASPGYLTLEKDKHVCVDDAASPHYSRIVSRAEAGPGTSGEEMAETPGYKHGLVVDYPTSREERAGSCIFIHIWQDDGQGTSGCVAAPEATVAALQDWAGGGRAAIVILPAFARDRFAACLP